MNRQRTSNLILHNEVNEHLLEEEYLSCLHSRKINSKFLQYGKKESDRWLTVCQHKIFPIHEQELALLRRTVSSMIKLIYAERGKNYNLISLGIGDGKADEILLHAFPKGKKFSYIPVDISENMIVQGIGEGLLKNFGKIDAYVSDFLDFSNFQSLSANTRRENYPYHFISFIGNRIGQLGNLEMLNRLRKGMIKGDYVLFGVSLQKKTDIKTAIRNVVQLMDYYSHPLFRDYVLTPMKYVGISTSDGEIEIVYGTNRYYPLLRTVEVFFCFNADKTVQYLNQEVTFLKGGKIRLLQEHIYPEETIHSLLNTFGFQVAEKYISADTTVGLYLCTLKEE